MGIGIMPPSRREETVGPLSNLEHATGVSSGNQRERNKTGSLSAPRVKFPAIKLEADSQRELAEPALVVVST